jgi:membrane fusion protein, adhesin transport system
MIPLPRRHRRPAAQQGRLSMIWLLFFSVAIFMAWAGWFEIDEHVRASGQWIPERRTQVIQAADGGVVAQILVKEGETVQAGQRIAVLEKDRSAAAFEESRARVAALQVALKRAEAEASGRAPQFGVPSPVQAPFVQAQQSLYAQRQRSLHDEITVLQDSLKLAQQEQQMNEALFKDGDTSQVEVMRAQRQVNEIQSRINGVENKYRQDARTEVAKLQEELSAAQYRMDEKRSVFDHTNLVAPLGGVIKSLRLNTVGGVLRPGDEMMQISPTDGGLVLELKVMPVDVGNVKQGQAVVIKLDAFDYAIHGTLMGELTYIGADTLTDQAPNGQSVTYYRAHARLLPASRQLNAKLAHVALKPGMTASVDILAHRRTVLQYLMKPITKSLGGALSER